MNINVNKYKNEFSEIKSIIKDIEDSNELFTALREYPSIHHKNFCGNFISFLIPIFKPYEYKYSLKEVIQITGIKNSVLYPLDIRDHMVDGCKFDKVLVKKSFLNALGLLDKHTEIVQSDIGDYLMKTLPFNQWTTNFILYTFSDTLEYNDSNTSTDYELYNFYGKTNEEIYKYILNFFDNTNYKKIDQLNRLYELNTSIDLDRVNTSIEMILKDLDFLIFYICNNTTLMITDPVYIFEDSFTGLYDLYKSYMNTHENLILSNSDVFKKPFFNMNNRCVVREKTERSSKDLWTDDIKFKISLSNINIYDLNIYKSYLQNFTGRKYVEAIDCRIVFSVVIFTHFYYMGLKLLEKLYNDKDIIVKIKFNSMDINSIYERLID